MQCSSPGNARPSRIGNGPLACARWRSHHYRHNRVHGLHRGRQCNDGRPRYSCRTLGACAGSPSDSWGRVDHRLPSREARRHTHCLPDKPRVLLRCRNRLNGMTHRWRNRGSMTKDQLLDILVGRRDYKAHWVWRIVAGMLAALAVQLWILVFRGEEHLNVFALIAVAYVSFLVVFIAVTGRLPRWLQPGRSDNMQRWSKE